MRDSRDMMGEVKKSRSKLIAMAVTYFMGVFNDNYFKMAAMLLALEAGKSHLQGRATVLFSLPFVLFAAHAGWIADRYPKKNVVVISKALELIAMMAGAAGIITLNWSLILAMVTIMGLQSTLFGPALNGSIPELYPEAYVPKANAIMKSVTTLAILMGIALAGITLDQVMGIDRVPIGKELVAGVVLFVALIGFIASFRVGKNAVPRTVQRFPFAGPLNSLKDFKTLLNDRELFIALMAHFTFYAVSSLAILLINTLGVMEFGYSNTTASLLSVSLMIGICIGSFLSVKLLRGKKWFVLLASSMAGIGAGLLLSGFSFLIPKFLEVYRQYYLMVMLGISGAAGGILLIPVASFIQTRPLNSEKGKVISVSYFMDFVGIMLSGQVFNVMDYFLKPSLSLLILGGGVMGLAWFFRSSISPFRERGRRNFSSLSEGSIFVSFILRILLSFRYRITVKGLDKIEQSGKRRVLFLPNHPALIDPVIVMAFIHRRFKPRPLADSRQALKPLLRYGIRIFDPILLEDMRSSRMVNRHSVLGALDKVAECLIRDENVLLYPGGRLKRQSFEYIGANSGVHYLLNRVKNVRVVLVRTTGLWGSSFSWAYGMSPKISDHYRRLIAALLAGGLFFLKKRSVLVEFTEPSDFPAGLKKMDINRYLENFYNESPDTFYHVRYFLWEKPKKEDFSGEKTFRCKTDLRNISMQTKKIINRYLMELTGLETVGEDDRLSEDLGIDSLKLADLVVFIENEFGFYSDDLEAFHSVGDLYLAAAGKLFRNGKHLKRRIHPSWFENAGDEVLCLPRGVNLGELFLNQAMKYPNRVILADEMSGMKTYRDLLLGIFVLKPTVEILPEESVGIMLPASVAASTLYFAILFAGKIPVMINWTTGEKNVRHAVRISRIRHIITSSKLVHKLTSQGVSPDRFECGLIFLEDVKRNLTLGEKMKAFIRSRFFTDILKDTPLPEIAVVLFTSGSETIPKAVPLTHGNLKSNLIDFAKILPFLKRDKMLGILPPFHSFGMTGNILVPVCYGIKTFYHANPMESVILSDIIDRYRITILMATPTFLNGIMNLSSPSKISSLRVVVTGAEKCPLHLFDVLERLNPQTMILEAYGITECSPAVSSNRPGEIRRGSIGRIFPSLEYLIVDENNHEVPKGDNGILLVRGPSIFGGYIGENVQSPFVMKMGKAWYNTGDLISEDENGILTFRGRLKRFVKMGGEMISLPAIEEALLNRMVFGKEENNPSIAVEAVSSNGTREVILFTTLEIKREVANRWLRDEGFSPLYNIRRVVRVDEIPVLGTGKTDYRSLHESFGGEGFSG